MENKMTALQALEEIAGYKPFEGTLDKPLNELRVIELLPNVNWEALKKTLTPPTSEEVAKAIQKYYGGSVVFKSGEFVLIGYEKPYTLAKLAGGEVKFHSRYSLPPHLIELIGRFYGGLK